MAKQPMLVIRLSEKTRLEFKAACAARGKSMTAVLRETIERTVREEANDGRLAR